ncbi:MAG: hypothetical protein EXR77_14195 [Myxococcales bacterium]|nr:hypothetical protein [Myxococcales bacterium]
MHSFTSGAKRCAQRKRAKSRTAVAFTLLPARLLVPAQTTTPSETGMAQATPVWPKRHRYGPSDTGMAQAHIDRGAHPLPTS